MKTYFATTFAGEEIEVGKAYSIDDEMRIEEEIKNDETIDEFWKVEGDI